MSLISMLKGRGPSGFGSSSTAEDVTDGLDLSGKTFLVTGCNSGLGAETMRVLTMRGGKVLALARTVEKAESAVALVDGEAVPYACELSAPAHVRACVAAIRADGHIIDAMILNAGIMALPDRTVQLGHELQFLTNHIGHFILATGLIDQLSPTGRVVALSSSGHQMAPKGGIQFDDLSFEGGYNSVRAYGQSKLANMLFARELARRLGDGQVAIAVHPGVIATNLGRHLPAFAQAMAPFIEPLFLKTPAQGAATQVWAAVHPDNATQNGEYMADCNVAKSSRHGRDLALATRLWTATEGMVAAL